MIKSNDLGSFSSVSSVWKQYPEGGREGDYVHIGSEVYVWNKYDRIWQPDSTTTTTDAYGTKTVEGNLNVQNDLIVGGKVKANDIVCNNVGLFPTLDALNAAYPSPAVGMWACVGDTMPAEIYVCSTAGTWTDTGETGGADVDLTDYVRTSVLAAYVTTSTLTSSLASYYTKEEADEAFVTASILAGYLSNNDAASLYLKQEDAASTYLKKADAKDTYLTQNDAEDYLKIQDAENIYLTPSSASSAYATKSAVNALKKTSYAKIVTIDTELSDDNVFVADKSGTLAIDTIIPIGTSDIEDYEFIGVSSYVRTAQGSFNSKTATEVNTDDGSIRSNGEFNVEQGDIICFKDDYDVNLGKCLIKYSITES